MPSGKRNTPPSRDEVPDEDVDIHTFLKRSTDRMRGQRVPSEYHRAQQSLKTRRANAAKGKGKA